jgi:alkylation response protein AidB-like acyl-CoA dehydrogenase
MTPIGQPCTCEPMNVAVFCLRPIGVRVCGSTLTMARTCVEEALAFARTRRTFGKFLIEHQAIQHKIGEMARQCEGLQAGGCTT